MEVKTLEKMEVETSERMEVKTTAKAPRIEEGMGCEIVCCRHMQGVVHKQTLNGPSWDCCTSYSTADGKDWVGQVMDQPVRNPLANTSTMIWGGH